MKIEIGKNYRKPNGDLVLIAGPTKHFPDWVYSIQGDWYTWAGERVTYRLHNWLRPDDGGKHYVVPGQYLTEVSSDE